MFIKALEVFASGGSAEGLLWSAVLAALEVVNRD
jgi:hypothetical protein